MVVLIAVLWCTVVERWSKCGRGRGVSGWLETCFAGTRGVGYKHSGELIYGPHFDRGEISTYVGKVHVCMYIDVMTSNVLSRSRKSPKHHL